VQWGLQALLREAGARLGLNAVLTFNLGRPEDFRVPDAGLIAEPVGVWHRTAVLVVEILSPDDGTFGKPDFYRRHGVPELLVLDWRTREVRVLDLQSGAERPDSAVLGLTVQQVVDAVDWPPVEG
jgi:Uma2 family endonuclease